MMLHHLLWNFARQFFWQYPGFLCGYSYLAACLVLDDLRTLHPHIWWFELTGWSRVPQLQMIVFYYIWPIILQTDTIMLFLEENNKKVTEYVYFLRPKLKISISLFLHSTVLKNCSKKVLKPIHVQKMGKKILLFWWEWG